MSTTVVVEQPAPSNRRQPVRQTRTNPSRTSTQAASAAVPVEAPESPPPEEHGFFPAITHFTDAITQLPREMIRHYTMLKEVDAKIFAPEEKLASLLSTGLKSTAPKLEQSQNDIEPLPEPLDPEYTHPRFTRRRHFAEIRNELRGLLLTHDEKIHVQHTAIECLQKQLERCDSSFPEIEKEISEEARLGSMTHWAYNTEKPAEKKSMIGTAMRSEARREAVAARRGRNQNNDSDFDDPRAYGKKAVNGVKGRKGEQVYGLGISNSGPPNKRRRVDQLGVGGVAMARSTSSAYGSNARGASPAVDSKKKARNGNNAANNRRRGGTLDSPVPASSPTVGTFSSSKNRQNNNHQSHNHDRSPGPAQMARIPSSRARQNSTQNNTNSSRNRSASTAQTNARVNGNHLESPALDKLSSVTGKSAPEIRSSMKETINAKGEHMIENSASGLDGGLEVRGAIVVDRSGSGSTHTSRTRGDRPPSISTRGGSKGAGASKNATPLTGSFSTNNANSTGAAAATSNSATAPAATRDVPKRSHKKGQGLHAQRLAAAVKAAGGGDDIDGEDEIDGEDGDADGEDVRGDEKRYCYCNDFSYGEMVGCDNEACKTEWFHLQCVGLTRAPGKNTKWYCEDCKEAMKTQSR